MSYSVLIVDDSKLARMSVAKLLNAIQPDWLRIEAGNADEAVQMVETAGADIALLDFNMPGRDGLELAADLIARKPDMPIALISANHQVEIISRAAAIGAHFLPKPLTQDALTGFLQSAVARLLA